MKIEMINKNTARIFSEDGEVKLSCFGEENREVTVLFVAEGIEVIEEDSLRNFLYVLEINLPRSLKSLPDGLFSKLESNKIRVNYAGNSADFIALAKPTITQEYVPGSFDHYPYYSDYGATYRDVILAFDNGCDEVEVFCAEDEVYLYYGKKYKEPSAEIPMSREEKLAKEEAARRREEVRKERIRDYFKQAVDVYLACHYPTQINIFICTDAFEIYEGKLCLAFKKSFIYTYVSREPEVVVSCKVGKTNLKVNANATCEDDDKVRNDLAKLFNLKGAAGYEFVYLDIDKAVYTDPDSPTTYKSTAW